MGTTLAGRRRPALSNNHMCSSGRFQRTWGAIGSSASDLTLFESIRLEFVLEGVTEEQGSRLVERFKGR